MKALQSIIDWSEVWALLLPIGMFTRFHKQPLYFKPVILYLIVAFFVNLIIDVSWKYPNDVPSWLISNNFLYNIHSIVRFICFSAFLMSIGHKYMHKAKRIVALLSLSFLVINFVFFEPFYNFQTFSSRLFSIEAGVLLFYCLLYYLYKFQDESFLKKHPPDFWIVTGLSIYVVFNFPYFLLYTTLMKNQVHFAEVMWNFHNISFIILCIFISFGFYVAGHR